MPTDIDHKLDGAHDFFRRLDIHCVLSKGIPKILSFLNNLSSCLPCSRVKSASHLAYYQYPWFLCASYTGSLVSFYGSSKIIIGT